MGLCLSLIKNRDEEIEKTSEKIRTKNNTKTFSKESDEDYSEISNIKPIALIDRSHVRYSKGYSISSFD